MVRGAWLMVRGSSFMGHGSWLKKLMAHGSWVIARANKGAWSGAPGPGPVVPGLGYLNLLYEVTVSLTLALLVTHSPRSGLPQ